MSDITHCATWEMVTRDIHCKESFQGRTVQTKTAFLHQKKCAKYIDTWIIIAYVCGVEYFMKVGHKQQRNTKAGWKNLIRDKGN